VTPGSCPRDGRPAEPGEAAIGFGYCPDWSAAPSPCCVCCARGRRSCRREASKREVHCALCDDRRTLLRLANQRAIEYHPDAK
jgi:hypothetical protein